MVLSLTLLLYQQVSSCRLHQQGAQPLTLVCCLRFLLLLVSHYVYSLKSSLRFTYYTLAGIMWKHKPSDVPFLYFILFMGILGTTFTPWVISLRILTAVKIQNVILFRGQKNL